MGPMITRRKLLLLLLCVNVFPLAAQDSDQQIPKALRPDALRSRKGFQWKVDHSANYDKTVWQQGIAKVPDTFGKNLSQLEQEWLSAIDATDANSFVYSTHD